MKFEVIKRHISSRCGRWRQEQTLTHWDNSERPATAGNPHTPAIHRQQARLEWNLEPIPKAQHVITPPFVKSLASSPSSACLLAVGEGASVERGESKGQREEQKIKTPNNRGVWK